MTGAVLDRPRSTHAERAAAGGRGTLEERLNATLRAVRLDGVAECPLCAAAMTRDGGRARCGSCGSTLS